MSLSDTSRNKIDKKGLTWAWKASRHTEKKTNKDTEMISALFLKTLILRNIRMPSPYSLIRGV